MCCNIIGNGNEVCIIFKVSIANEPFGAKQSHGRQTPFWRENKYAVGP